MTRPVLSALTRSVAQSSTRRALPEARAAVDVLTEQLATGYRIQRPSDDPGGFAQARALGQVQARLGQYGRAVDAAALWADQTQAQIDGLNELFASARDLGLRAANGVLDADALADEVESLRAETIARLNAESAGEHLFAGNATTTAPVNPDGTIAPGDFSGERTREVAPGVTVTLNVTTALEVDGVAAPERLQALADAIRSGDRDAIADAIDGAAAGIEHYARLGGQSGGVSRTLDRAREATEAQDLVVGERRASIEEVDLAETYGALQRRQVGLEAALRASAATVQQTLLDYL